MTSILVIVFAIAMFPPNHVWAIDYGANPAVISATSASSDVSEDHPDEPSSLMVMGDFNRDGITDKAEVVSSAKNHDGLAFLAVSLGQGDGTFKKLASTSVLSHDPRALVIGDFNGDGLPDLILGDDNGALQLFLGDGTGRMVPAGDIAHLSSVVSIAVADFNHDSIPDLVVTDWRASLVTVFLGVGNGSFRRVWSSPLRMPGTAPYVAVADFNGDHILDLVVVYDDDEGDTYEVMVGNGKGAFTDAPRLSLARDPNSHCVT
jgi:hypothetical protein